MVSQLSREKSSINLDGFKACLSQVRDAVRVVVEDQFRKCGASKMAPALLSPAHPPPGPHLIPWQDYRRKGASRAYQALAESNTQPSSHSAINLAAKVSQVNLGEPVISSRVCDRRKVDLQRRKSVCVPNNHDQTPRVVDPYAPNYLHNNCIMKKNSPPAKFPVITPVRSPLLSFEIFCNTDVEHQNMIKMN